MTVSGFFIYTAQTMLAVSILTGLVLLVRRPFAKAFGSKAAYALWSVPLLRLVMPPLPAGWTLFSPPQPLAGETVVSTLTFAPASPYSSAAGIAPHAPAAPIAPVVTEPMIVSPVAGPPTGLDAFVEMLAGIAPWLVTLWLAGTCLVFMLAMYRQKVTSDLIRAEGRLAGPSLQRAADETANAIGLSQKNISVQTSLISSGPLVTGLFRPIVLLPEWFEADYTPEERRVALMHEFMHIKRGDLMALQLATLFTAVQWFNPLAWAALKAFRTDQEAACDADVLGVGEASPHAYGSTLVKAVRLSRPVAQPVQAASLPLNHALHERLSQMKNPLPTRRRERLASTLTASVGAAALLVSACATSTAQTTELEGGPDEDVRVEAHAIFISDDQDGSDTHVVMQSEGGEELRFNSVDEITLDGAELDGDVHIKSRMVFVDGEAGEEDGQRVVVIRKNGGELIEDALEDLGGLEELATLTALGGLEGLEGLEALGEVRAISGFSWEYDGVDKPPFVAEFAREMRALASDPEANRDEIAALEEKFEADMENWVAEKHAVHGDVNTKIRVLQGGHDGSVTTSGTLALDGKSCEEGQVGQRTVTIRRDDGEETSFIAHCATSIEAFDPDNVMNTLRERGDLSEARLAEIEEKLHKARENIAITQSRIQSIDLDLDTDEVMDTLRARGDLSEARLAEIEEKLHRVREQLAVTQSRLEGVDVDVRFEFDEDSEAGDD